MGHFKVNFSGRRYDCRVDVHVIQRSVWSTPVSKPDSAILTALWYMVTRLLWERLFRFVFCGEQLEMIESSSYSLFCRKFLKKGKLNGRTCSSPPRFFLADS
jgi:hypothetical protein